MTTTIVLELTQREAENLAALTLRGIAWSWAGRSKINTDAQAIYDALTDAGVHESTANRVETGALPRWTDKR